MANILRDPAGNVIEQREEPETRAIPLATQETDGLMSAEDKLKLDGLEEIVTAKTEAAASSAEAAASQASSAGTYANQAMEYSNSAADAKEAAETAATNAETSANAAANSEANAASSASAASGSVSAAATSATNAENSATAAATSATNAASSATAAATSATYVSGVAQNMVVDVVTNSALLPFIATVGEPYPEGGNIVSLNLVPPSSPVAGKTYHLTHKDGTLGWRDGGSGGTPAIAVSDANAEDGTIQVRPITIDESGAASWNGEAVTARYGWAAPEGALLLPSAYTTVATGTHGLLFGSVFVPLRTAATLSAPDDMTADESDEWIVSASSLLDSGTHAYYTFNSNYPDATIYGTHLGSNQPHWMQWRNKLRKVLIRKIIITAYGGGDTTWNGSLTTLNLEGSDDGVTWTTIGKLHGPYSAAEQIAHYLPYNTAKYYYHRVYSLSPATYMTIGNIAAYSEV